MNRNDHQYIGSSLTRREDRRLLTGDGVFVADIRLPGMLDVALVRSQVAHARIVAVDLARARCMQGVELVLDGAGLAEHLAPIPGMQVSAPPGWAQRVDSEIRLPAQPVLAVAKTHYVGEPLAVVVASDANRAADAAEMVEVQIEPLPWVANAELGRADNVIVMHDELDSNVLARMSVAKGAVGDALARAPHRLQRRISHHRYAAMPMECRGVVADYDRRTDSLTVWSASQVVHWVRAQLAKSLDMAEAQIRVIAPDVGGGFGVKGHVYPEELLVAWLARRLRRPVRWLEQRQEHFLGSTHSRDNVHEVEFGFDGQGRVLALRDECLIDSGAYSPVGSVVAYNTTAHMLGPYDVAHFEASTAVVCTNKMPNAPYRGAGRPEAVQVMERVLDVIAATLRLEPAEVRFRNMIQPQQMPYEVGLPYRDGQPIVYDSGDYPKALRRALDEIGGVDAFRARQREARREGRYLGLGIGCYTEGTGVGPFEGARVELDLSGKLIVAVGACPQGQGHETVFAQVAAQSWRMPIDDVVVKVADTGMVAMGYGTVGSRSTVTASMAIEGASEQVKQKVMAVAAELLEASVEDLQFHDGGVCVTGAADLRVSLADVARAAMPGWQHRRPQNVQAGLQASSYYEPSTVTWSYAANAAIVEVEPHTGQVLIERYVEVHDAGVLLNPALADGQITGGIVQGIGGAIMEAIVYDEHGQLLSGSFLDYALPRALDVPPITVIHHQTPSPLNALGVKGLGEGGAIAPPVVIANGLADALRDSGHEFNALPIRAAAVRNALADLATGDNAAPARLRTR
jgi:carbon-monoxide dehydrogenase large subunit